MASLLLCATQTQADIKDATAHAQSLYADFAVAAQALEITAQEDCLPSAIRPAYHTGFDAWVAASSIQFGPILEIGGPLNFAFWPDKKGFAVKKLNQMIAKEDSIVDTQVAFQEVSVAARGFLALERLLFDDAFLGYTQGDYTCALVRAITTDIRTKAQSIETRWNTTFSDELDAAILGNGAQFHNENEVAAAFLTSLIAGLEYIETARIARPLGSLENPRPKRAESWRSGRSLRNIQISLQSLSKLADVLADGNAPVTQESFVSLIAYSNTISSVDFQDVQDLAVRFQLESLSSLVTATHEAATVELSEHLGVASGFNALDGD
jgi:predicted lipoprotein